MVEALKKRAEAEAWKETAKEKLKKANEAQLKLNELNNKVTKTNRTIHTQRERAAGNKTYVDNKKYVSTGPGAKSL